MYNMCTRTCTHVNPCVRSCACVSGSFPVEGEGYCQASAAVKSILWGSHTRARGVLVNSGGPDPSKGSAAVVVSQNHASEHQ